MLRSRCFSAIEFSFPYKLLGLFVWMSKGFFSFLFSDSNILLEYVLVLVIVVQSLQLSGVSFKVLSDFLLVFPKVSGRHVLLSLTTVMNLTIFFFSCQHFPFYIFEAILLRTY